MSGGEHTYGKNQWARYDLCTLEAGKITVFSRVLKVSRYNATPGRGMTTAYSQSFVNLTHAKGNEIVETLSELPNFFPWEMQERR